MSNKTTKAKYLPPVIEVIEVENEGVIAASGNFSDLPGGGSVFPVSNSRSSSGKSNIQSSSSLSELEDLINDIFTIEN